MYDIQRMNAWVEDVYLPKLRARDDEMVFERSAENAGQREKRAFSEHFLQIVWNERYLQLPLKTTSGKSLSIVHPGTWNVAEGPDFRNAALVIDGKLLRGDVEIHIRASDWRHHNHVGNPEYDNCILHVVWKDDVNLPEGPPNTLVLDGAILPSWRVLLEEIEDASYPYARCVTTGQCAMRWAMMDNLSVQTLLASAGLARLAARSERMACQCRQIGADQTLYEGYFDCLGFRSNRQPFLELARCVPLSILRENSAEFSSSVYPEAMLFGTAGFLPDLTQQNVLPKWQETVKLLWNTWWETGGESIRLPWKYAGTRPFNSPYRRLAAGIEWLRLTEFQPVRWLSQRIQGVSTPAELLRALSDYPICNSRWESCTSFTARLRQSAKLLGMPRRQDIVANLFLPFLCAMSGQHGFPDGLDDLVRHAFVSLPPGQENQIIREASHRFLMPPSRSHEILKRYCHQQGLLNLYRNFCQAFSADCTRCPFATAAE